MKRNVTFVALGVAGLCAFMFWTQFLRHYGSFQDGRYVDPETGRVFVERAGLMWGSLFLIALVLLAAVWRRSR